ncbi:MAG TPA: hypothetical protein VF699_00985 [Caulobacteraceae bacterium]|jgi:hypothetical protein
MHLWLSLLLLLAAMALLATHLRWSSPIRRKQILMVAMLLMAGSSLTLTIASFLEAEDRRASALERLHGPATPPTVAAWAERDLLTEPSPVLLLNAILGGVVLGAGAMGLLRSRPRG